MRHTCGLCIGIDYFSIGYKAKKPKKCVMRWKNKPLGTIDNITRYNASMFNILYDSNADFSIVRFY